MLKVLVIQGPNLNLLGTREVEKYGKTTMDDLHVGLTTLAKANQVEIEFFQSNHEGTLVDKIQEAKTKFNGILINAGAFTHTSIAIRDALTGIALPFVEVHISNIHAREEFRQVSYLSAVSSGVVVGFGVDGYRLGLLGLVEKLK